MRPDVRGWKRIASQAPELAPHRDLGSNLGAWVLGCAMIYFCLFGTGKLLLHQAGTAMLLLCGSVICAFFLYRGVVQNFKVEPVEETAAAPLQ